MALTAYRGGGLMSKIVPLCSMLNFSADVKKTTARQRGFHTANVRSFFGLTSKIPPKGSMLNFDATSKTTARHPI